MKKIRTKMVDFLKTKSGEEVNVNNLALNEAEKLPDGFVVMKENFQVYKILNPNKAYSKYMSIAEDINFESDKYDYYTVKEFADKISLRGNATWNLRVPKEQEC